MSDGTDASGARTSTRSPCSSAVFAVAGPIHATTVDACGLPAVVSSALDTSVGIAAGVALAAALPDLYGACGLGTLNLMAGDVTSDPLLPRDGTLPVCRPVPSAGLLQEYAVAPAREKWWRERVAACYPLLPA